MDSEDIRKQVLDYLNKRYPEDSFQIEKLNNDKAPGDQIDSYSVKVNSDNYTRKSFSMNMQINNDSIEVTRDGYPTLLLSEAYLEKLKKEFPTDDDIFYDVVLGHLNTDIPDLTNLHEANEYLQYNEQITWINLIGVYIEDYNDTTLLVETITPIAYNIRDIYLGNHRIEFYFYPKEMKAKNLQFQSNGDMSRKAPAKEKQVALWIIKWRKSQHDEMNGRLESFIKNRKEIKKWRSKNSSN